jgi:16S rRNA (uracil1498-N3)-methyltransferase
MNSFYLPGIYGKTIQLSLEESRHCVKVLRLKKGDRIQLMNGKGSIFEAAILDPDPKGCQLEIVDEISISNNRNYQLTIAIAPTKNIDRLEWFLEKSTEIGIDRIVPLICQHAERKEVKSERLEKILVAAMKQSGQAFLPELTSQVTFKSLINSDFEGIKLIAHCERGPKTKLKDAVQTGKNVLILIGPEGDFDPSEIALALKNGFIPVSLGESRLRTETAGVVACHTVCLVNEK